MRKPNLQLGGTLSILLILILLAAGVGGWWYWSKSKNPEVAYQTIPILKGDVTQIVTATGTLNPVINVQVGSQISGIIQALHADYNSPVKAGQVVAQIDPATYEATVMQAEGELASAEAALELARVNEKRARELEARKAAPSASLDQAVATLHQAEAQVKIRQGSLKRARVDLERCTIYSPVDGIVISRSVDVGQTVAASLSAPVIFTIANDLAKMQIDANVAEADVGNVREGQEVTFTVDAYPSRTFRGKVIQVRNSPITVQNVVSYDAVIEVNNDDLKLKPGMTATTSIIVATENDVLKLGAAALRFQLPESEKAKLASSDPQVSPSPQGGDAPRLREGGEGRARGGRGGRGGRGNRDEVGGPRTIYLLSDGKPKAVTVKTGITDGIYTAVSGDIKEGDLAITGITTGKQKSMAPQGANPFTPRPPGGGGMGRRL